MHSSRPLQGQHISFIAFCHQMAPQLDGYQRQELARWGYPISWWDPRSHIKLKMRAFLDVFSGGRSPLTRALMRIGKATLEPLDIHVRQSGQAGDLLNDPVFDFIIRLAWSGAVAAAILAPPCSAYSKLRLRPGGPKAVRTAEHMNGVPGLTGKRRTELETSKMLHERSAAIMNAIIVTG